jgi:hypothetical protein
MRKGTVCEYQPALLDRIDGRTSLQPGDIVRVCHPYGCPKPGTMGHAHVETLDGDFIGLVQVASLTPVKKTRSK